LNDIGTIEALCYYYYTDIFTEFWTTNYSMTVKTALSKNE